MKTFTLDDVGPEDTREIIKSKLNDKHVTVGSRRRQK